MNLVISKKSPFEKVKLKFKDDEFFQVQELLAFYTLQEKYLEKEPKTYERHFYRILEVSAASIFKTYFDKRIALEKISLTRAEALILLEIATDELPQGFADIAARLIDVLDRYFL